MAYYTDPSVVAGFSTTGDPFIDSLFDADPSYRFAWSTTVGGVTQISYSFPWLNGVGSKFISGYGSGENLRVNSPSSVTASDVTYIGQAFQAWAAVANVNFTQVTETNAGQVGDIRIAFTGVIPSQYWGYTIVTSDGADNSNGDMWISNSVRSESFAPYTYNYNAILHEIGHTLGLKHPFEAPTIPSGYDNRRFTIMSYTDPQNAYWYDKSTGTYKYLITTPMVYDIAAVQHIYGANMTYHTGDDTYTYSPNQPFYATIWDAGGNDTINLSAFSNPCVVDLHPGSYSLLGFNGVTLDPNLGIAFGCTIENAVGGQGADAIDGNDVANVLKGGGGGDTLTGEAGRDTLYGGAGMDHLYGGAGNDILSGGDGNDQLFGGSGADQLMGGYGADILHGGTGDDYLYGQAGNDTLYADSGADKLFGGDGNDVLYAGTGNSKLYGGNGNDILHGGAGHALLTGGAGADTFLFDKGETGGLTPTSCVEITDFNPAQGDIISLAPMTTYDPYAGASVPTQIGTALTLTFIGSAAFSHTTGEVRYEVDSGYTLIEGDTNGDGQADFMIRLDGVTTFAASELVL